MILRELAVLVDKYMGLRNARLELDRQSAKLKEQESEIRALILRELLESKAGGVAGKSYRAEVRHKKVPQVVDWDKLYVYIKDNDAFELLQKRLSPPAVVERWENHEAVPGVVEVTVDDLSVTKLP
jgi:hypothetical protein